MISVICELGLLEPEVYLEICGLHAIWAMNKIITRRKRQVSPNSSLIAIKIFGGADNLSASEDYVITFPNHSKDWAWRSEFH